RCRAGRRGIPPRARSPGTPATIPSAAADEALDQLDEARAAFVAGNVSRLRRERCGKSRDVRNADGIFEEREHRRVVRGIAGEAELALACIQIDAEALGKQASRHRELVIAAEPAVYVDRADLGRES